MGALLRILQWIPIFWSWVAIHGWKDLLVIWIAVVVCQIHYLSIYLGASFDIGKIFVLSLAWNQICLRLVLVNQIIIILSWSICALLNLVSLPEFQIWQIILLALLLNYIQRDLWMLSCDTIYFWFVCAIQELGTGCYLEQRKIFVIGLLVVCLFAAAAAVEHKRLLIHLF